MIEDINELSKNTQVPQCDKTVVSGSFLSPEFEKEAEKMQSLMAEITSKIVKQTDEKLWEYFEPYLREAGIKGEITKGKIKWRGIKLKVQNDLESCKYQLCQRGVDISPVFTFEFPSPLNYR
jgi:hypothetical protein